MEDGGIVQDLVYKKTTGLRLFSSMSVAQALERTRTVSEFVSNTDNYVILTSDLPRLGPHRRIIANTKSTDLQIKE